MSVCAGCCICCNLRYHCQAHLGAGRCLSVLAMSSAAAAATVILQTGRWERVIYMKEVEEVWFGQRQRERSEIYTLSDFAEGICYPVWCSSTRTSVNSFTCFISFVRLLHLICLFGKSPNGQLFKKNKLIHFQTLLMSIVMDTWLPHNRGRPVFPLVECFYFEAEMQGTSSGCHGWQITRWCRCI